MAPLNSFILQYLFHNQFIFCFQKMKALHWKTDLIANFTANLIANLQSFINTIYITQYITQVTKNIFNLYESHQNMWNCKSLFQQIFVVYKTFLVVVKAKNLLRTTRFGLWSFYEDVLQNDYLWSSYTGLTIVKIKIKSGCALRKVKRNYIYIYIYICMYILPHLFGDSICCF